MYALLSDKSIGRNTEGCVKEKRGRNGVLKVNYIPKTDWHIALQKSALLPSSSGRNELI